ncbi:hypothetical protein [Mediterraneibacter gnavus]|uniref:hypothetical protein n=1 Tax=Mediterraneibacter gnavus TaxID=33038 RepID=UPI00206CA523|nr:hypothetical protein [Mediterraneibacter gnavus]MDB8711645.1 hypothetical protein [Mediterraneibacter gnavus]MDB8714655.1 hypothetical protein [Mediterraneibacter gnavus]DAG81522.1 MAG TPA: hypothetical protein [Caudoviricetes sp.]
MEIVIASIICSIITSIVTSLVVTRESMSIIQKAVERLFVVNIDFVTELADLIIDRFGTKRK